MAKGPQRRLAILESRDTKGRALAWPVRGSFSSGLLGPYQFDQNSAGAMRRARSGDQGGGRDGK